MKFMSLRRLGAASFIFASLLGSYRTSLLCMSSAAGSSSIPLESLQAVNQDALQACINEWAARGQDPRPSLASAALGQENCNLCRTPLVDGEKQHRYVALPCPGQAPHVFHQSCIQLLFTQPRDCPLCHHQAAAQELETCGAVNRELVSYAAILQSLRDRAAVGPLISAFESLGIQAQLEHLTPNRRSHPIPALELAGNRHISEDSRRAIKAAMSYAFANPEIDTCRLFALSAELLANGTTAGWGPLMALQFSWTIVTQSSAGKPTPPGALDAVHTLFQQSLNRLHAEILQRLLQGNEPLAIIDTACSIALAVPNPTNLLAADFVINLACQCLSSPQTASLLARSAHFERFITSPSFSVHCQHKLSNADTIPMAFAQLGRLAASQHALAVWKTLETLDDATWRIITESFGTSDIARNFLYCLSSLTTNSAAPINVAIWRKIDSLDQTAWHHITHHLNDLSTAINFLICLNNLAANPDRSMPVAIWRRLESLGEAVWVNFIPHFNNLTFAHYFQLCLGNLAYDADADLQTDIWNRLDALGAETWTSSAQHLNNPTFARDFLSCLGHLTGSTDTLVRTAIWDRLAALGDDAWAKIAQNLDDLEVVGRLLRCLGNLAYNPDRQIKIAIWNRLNTLGDQAWATLNQVFVESGATALFLRIISSFALNPDSEAKTAILHRLESLSAEAWNNIMQQLGELNVAQAFMICFANLAFEANEAVGTSVWNKLDALGEEDWDKIAATFADEEITRVFLACLINLTSISNEQMKASIWTKLETLGEGAWRNILANLNTVACSISFLGCLNRLANSPNEQIKIAIWHRLETLGEEAWSRLEGHLFDESFATQLVDCLTTLTTASTPEIKAAAETKLQDIRAKIELAEQQQVGVVDQAYP